MSRFCHDGFSSRYDEAPLRDSRALGEVHRSAPQQLHADGSLRLRCERSKEALDILRKAGLL